MTGPRVIAGFVQSTLDALETLGPDVAARIRARMAPETVEAIRDASRVAWAPLRFDVELTNCLFAEVGAERGRAFMRENLRKAFDLPILRSLVDTAVRLLGRDPERVLRWAPRVWSQLFRDCGTLHCATGASHEMRLELSALPDEVLHGREWLDGAAAAVAATFDILRVDGEARLDGPDRAARTAVIVVRWKLPL